MESQRVRYNLVTEPQQKTSWVASNVFIISESKNAFYNHGLMIIYVYIYEVEKKLHNIVLIFMI